MASPSDAEFSHPFPWKHKRIASSSSESSAHAADSSELLICLFVFIVLGIGTILRAFSKWTKVPYTPLVLAVGILLGALADHFGLLGDSATLASNINPQGFLTIFIPALIFESAFNVEWHVFRREIWGILLIAGPGVLLAVGWHAIVLKIFLAYDSSSLSWYDSLTVGSIVAPTDPVAAVSLLRELGAPATLNTILEGASLTNDGSAMVFFTLFSQLAKGTSLTGADGILSFLRLAGGGVALGLAFGVVGTYLFSRITNDNKMLTTTSFVLAYLSFYVAEDTSVHFSGVLCTVTAGIYMAAKARVKLTKEAETELLRVWEWGQYVVETLIFFLTGAIIGVNTASFGDFLVGSDWWKMFLFYIFMNAGRFVVLLVMRPLISKLGYGLNLKETVVLSWGGLRGALGLALALFIEVDSSYSVRLRKLAVFYTAAMVVLTLFVNGLTVGFLVKCLKIIKVPEIKKKIEQSILTQQALESNLSIERFQHSPYLRLCDWDHVRQIIGYDSFVKKLADEKRRLQHQNTVRPIPQHSPRLIRQDSLFKTFTQQEIEVEARFRLLTMLRVMILEKHEEGFLSSDAMRALREACNFNLDDPSRPIFIWEILKKQFYSEKMFNFILRLKNWKFRIGKLANRLIGDQLYLSYDCASTLIVITDELLSHQTEMPFMTSQLRMIIKELADTRDKATLFVNELEERFVGIMRDVQIHRASSQILLRNKSVLDKFMEEGKIVEAEYEKMISHINDKLNNMSKLQSDWMDRNNLIDSYLKYSLFKGLMDSEIQELKRQSQLVPVIKGSYLFQKDQKVEYLYITAQGTMIEVISEDKQMKRPLGTILSFSTVINSTGRAELSVVAASDNCLVYQIPISFIRGLMKRSSDFNEKIYKHALYEIVRIYPADAGGLELIAMDEMEFNYFASTATFETVEKDEELSLAHGGYIFEGKVRLTNQQVTTEFLKKEQEEQKDDPKSALIKLRKRRSKIHSKSIIPSHYPSKNSLASILDSPLMNTLKSPGVRNKSNELKSHKSPKLTSIKSPEIIEEKEPQPDELPDPGTVANVVEKDGDKPKERAFPRDNMRVETNIWSASKHHSVSPLSEKKPVRDHTVEHGEHSYVPGTKKILVAVENLKILRFKADVKLITDAAGENLMQKIMQSHHESKNPNEMQDMEIEPAIDKRKNLYSNLVFDVMARQKLEEAQEKENKLASIKKLRKYANVIKGALTLARLGKLGIKKKATMQVSGANENSCKDPGADIFRHKKANAIPKPRLNLKLPFGEFFTKSASSKRERESARSKDEKRSARYNDPNDVEDSKNFTLLPKVDSTRGASLLKKKASERSAREIKSSGGEQKVEFAIKEPDGEMDIGLSPKADSSIPL